MHNVIFVHHNHMMAYIYRIERIVVIYSYYLLLKNQRDYCSCYDTYFSVFAYYHYRYHIIESYCSLNVFASDYLHWMRSYPHLCPG